MRTAQMFEKLRRPKYLHYYHEVLFFFLDVLFYTHHLNSFKQVKHWISVGTIHNEDSVSFVHKQTSEIRAHNVTHREIEG